MAVPTAGIGNQMINFYGVHRIFNLGDIRDFGDIKSLKIGDYICNRLDIFSSYINSNKKQMIPCKVAK